jgi:hypothetical protein
LLYGTLAIVTISGLLDNDNAQANNPSHSLPRSVSRDYIAERRTYYPEKTPQKSATQLLNKPLVLNQRHNVESQVVEAINAYKQLKWDDAFRILKTTINSDEISESCLYQAYFLLGAMEYQMGNIMAAQMFFVKAHQHDSSRSPSPELFPPQVIEFYKKANQKK